MKFLSFLFGSRKKDAAPCTEPSVAPVGVTTPSPTLERAPAPPQAGLLPGRSRDIVIAEIEAGKAARQSPPTSPPIKARPDPNKSYAHLNYTPRLSPKKENTDPAPERAPAPPQAEPAPPATSRVEPALAPIEPQTSPSSTAVHPAPSERAPAALPRNQARVQWRGYPIGVVGEVYNQEALIALCGPYTSQVGVGDTFGYGQKFDAVIELEPTNSHDPNAVVVKIKGHRVGYLPRDQAARVGQQMRDEGLEAAICDAIVDGGWRVNQHESGLRPYEVRVGIPDKGWIDFGIDSLPPLQPETNRPMSSGRGPLRKEWIALLGIEPDSDTARQLAKNGARIMAGPGVSTTFLVVAENQPFSDEIKRSKTYQKAEELIAKGARLRIVSLDEMRKMIEKITSLPF